MNPTPPSASHEIRVNIEFGPAFTKQLGDRINELGPSRWPGDDDGQANLLHTVAAASFLFSAGHD
jgi:hypothetical protein